MKKEIKVAKWGTPKKYLKKNRCGLISSKSKLSKDFVNIIGLIAID
jgi:hypothetical protein